MKLLIHALMVVIYVAAFSHCRADGYSPTAQGIHSNEPNGSEPNGPAAAVSSPAVPVGTLEIVGTVSYKDLEGGFYAIDGDDGKKYDPINLPEAFRQDGLRVKATVRLKPEMMGFHMYGSIVDIVDITTQ